MTKDNVVKIRRATISNYLDDNATIGYDEARKISDELGIHYETVRNDLKWLKARDDEIYKKYNLEGLRRKAVKKVERLEKLQEKMEEILADENTTNDDIFHATRLIMEITHNTYQLEHNGVGVLTREMENNETK